MPPYAPDHNSIEHVWNEVKNSISNRQSANFDDAQRAFTPFTKETSFPYPLPWAFI